MDDTVQPANIGEKISFKELKTKEAKELAAWYAIQLDLESVTTWLMRLLDEFKKQSVDSALCSSLWTSSLIHYARCFATGRGKRGAIACLTPEVYGDKNGGLHEWLINMRSKTSAHSVNGYEQYKTGIGYVKRDEGFFITGISPQRMFFGSAIPQACSDFLGLARLAHDHAVQQVAELTDNLNEQIKTMSYTEIEKAPPLRFYPPHPEDVDKDRNY